jgi:catechol 2,3-dioxygenase-like lactoylglutathione lyase family enzyme
MSQITGILETSLYVTDLDRAMKFYQDVFGFPTMFEDDRLRALAVAGKQVLLLFKRGASAKPLPLERGDGAEFLPPHDGAGQYHLAFSIGGDELPKWEDLLAAKKLPIESRIHWQRGGRSIYFRDPDQNLVELATPGIWSIF